MMEHMELSSAWRYVYQDIGTNETFITEEPLELSQMEGGRIRYKHSYKWYEKSRGGEEMGQNA